MKQILVGVVVFVCLYSYTGVQSSLLKFGISIGDSQLTEAYSQNGSIFTEVRLERPIVYFGESYTSVAVSN